MKKNHLCLIPVILSLAIFNISCSSISYREAYPTLLDGKYDSEFPYKSCSSQLEHISESIKFINCIVYYKTYVFKENSQLTRKALTQENIESNTQAIGHSENTAAGTATIIYNDGRRLAILTCAHVVNFEDTVFVYRFGRDGILTPYLQSIAIKQRQSNFISDLITENEFEILKMDLNQDIAVLGRELKEPLTQVIPVFDYPFGGAKNLEWGTFVYVFGYPLGYKTLTKALVSSPNKDKNGTFVVDAFFNRGFSGGIILAIKDGIPNFEMVGMIKSVPAEYEYVMKPFTSNEYETFSPLVPYTGSIFVERKVNIRYGISRAVPVESVVRFFKDNSSFLLNEGYDFSKLTSPAAVK